MENRSLVLDLVEWIAKEPRPYAEVMEAWKTSCPRLSVWEDATSSALLRRELDDDKRAMVRVTSKGKKLLMQSGRLSSD